MISFHAAHLGDFDPELHEKTTEYITEFKFIPNQVCPHMPPYTETEKQRGSIYIKFFILFVYLFSFKTKELEKEIQKKHKALM